jgi:hypothetical protein
VILGIVTNISLLDDVAVIITIEVGLKNTVLQIHLIEYLPKARVVVNFQSIERRIEQKYQDEQKYFHDESIEMTIRRQHIFIHPSFFSKCFHSRTSVFNEHKKRIMIDQTRK